MSAGHVDQTKLRPLSPDAIQVLRSLIREGARPRQTINPGIVNRLLREDLVDGEMRPSPYRTHAKGRMIEFMIITEAGRVVIAARDLAKASQAGAR